MTQAQAARRSGVNIFDDSKPIWRSFVVFLIPLILSNFMQSASSLIGAIYVGRLIGVRALATVSGIFPIIFFLISFLIGISNGSTVLIGQAYGAHDEHAMKKVAGTTLGVSFWMGVIVAFIGVFYSHVMLGWLDTPPDIFAQATRYAQWIFAVMPLFFPYLVYTTFLRGPGDSQTPFYFLVVGTVISLLVTPAFILGWFGLPKLGVEAAALSFIVANVAAFAALLVYLSAKKHPLRCDAETLRDALFIDFAILLKVIRIGVPTAVQMVLVSLAEIAVLSFVNHFGSNATAAYGAVNQIVAYVQFPAISISIAASIFGAQCIGARREDKMESVVHSGVVLNYIIVGTLVALGYIFAWDILGWFITAKNTLDIAHELLMITLWGYLLFGNAAVMSGVMRSSGDVLWPTAIGVFAVWGVEVPAAFFLMHRFALPGVWMGYPIAFFVSLCLQFGYFTLVWKKKTHERLI